MTSARAAAWLPALLAGSMLGGCSAQQWYHGAQYAQRNECRRIDERAERARCEKAASLPYADYKAEADRLKALPR
jgi:hypothetical protein